MILHTDITVATQICAFFEARTMPIIRAYQPTTQGASDNMLTYFKVSDHRYGSPQRVDIWDDVNDVMIHRDIQWIEATYQIGALSLADNASDMVNAAAIWLAGEEAINFFRAQEIGIERITEVRNPYFVNSEEQFQASPSFDVVLTFKRGRESISPTMTTYEYRIARV